MTNGWPFDGWVIVVAMDNGTGCTGYNGMPRLVFKFVTKMRPTYWSGMKTNLETTKATTNTATLVLIHGILDAEKTEQMEVHQKIAEMKLQFQMVQFTRDDIE